MARFRQKSVQNAVARGQVEDAVKAVCFAAERTAKRLVPRDTSVLANSIGVDVRTVGTRTTGTVGTNVNYGAPVEFGTHALGEPDAPGKRKFGPAKGRTARPYLRPGLQAGVTYARAKGLIK